MNLSIQGRNIEITEEIERYLNKKIGRLGRRLPRILEAKVELFREPTRSQQDRIVGQVTLNCDGTMLRAQERGPSAFAVIDAVSHALDQQVQRYKGKLYRVEQAKRARRQPRTGAPEAASLEGTDEETVVRIKRFPMKPVSVEEAIVQMELLGHDFFLFRNQETDEFNVVYRRRSGGYGLIEPEPM